MSYLVLNIYRHVTDVMRVHITKTGETVGSFGIAEHPDHLTTGSGCSLLPGLG